MSEQQVIDLSNYYFENLVFKRDLTGGKNDLLVFDGENPVHQEAGYFASNKPTDIVKAKDEDDQVYEYSIENVAEIYRRERLTLPEGSQE